MSNVNQSIRSFMACFALLCSLSLAVHAQTNERERMAVALEQGNDVRSAARMYLELLQDNPNNQRYFDGVVRTLSALSQYESLLPIAEQYAGSHPSVEVEILLATIAVKTAKNDEVHWTKALALGNRNESTYAAVGKAQADCMLTKKAIDSYEHARSLANDNKAYSNQLALLYGRDGNYPAAVREILAVFSINGDEYAAKGKLAAIMATPEGRKAVGEGLETEARMYPDVLRIQWWYLTQVGQWNEAFIVAKEVDQKERLAGRAILQFAEAARKEQAYDVAIKAYGELLNAAPTIAIAASYGYTQTLDQKLSNTVKRTASDATSLIERYRVIAESHATHPLAANALLRMAQLSISYLSDTSAAIDALTQLINRWRGTTSAAEGTLLLSDLYFAKGNRTASDDLLASLARMANPFTAQSKLRLADHQLFDGDIASAQTTYLELSALTETDAANDAIERLGLLLHMPDDSLTVRGIIQGMKLVALGNIAEAVKTYSQNGANARDPELADRAHLEAATLLMRMADTTQIRSQLQSILQRIPETTLGDRALEIIADLYIREGNLQEAINTLTTLLVQYPRSILAPSSRERIRKLRGDA